MNNEIEEMLNKINNVVEHKEASYNALVETKAEDYKLLLDYITNLQQDNEMYAQLKDEYEEEIKDLQQENERLKENNNNMQIEMARCWEKIDKAIEYINNTIEDKPITDFDYGSNNTCNDLLNILQNGSDEDEK